MAEAWPGTTFHKLDSLRAWHVRKETYSKAIAEIVNYQHSLAFSDHWGAGTTSSFDGQYFHVGGRGEHAGQVNARYGSGPGLLSTRISRTATRLSTPKSLLSDAQPFIGGTINLK
jgi:TnpA family transposase